MPVISGGAGGGSGGGVGTLAFATATIANADILTLPTTPVQIVASPGANKSLVVVHATLRLARTADYTNINGNAQLAVNVGPDSFFALHESPGSGVSGLLAFGSDSGIWGWPGPLSAFQLALAGDIDSEVVAQPATLAGFNDVSGNFTGGNAANSLAVTLLYYVVSV